MVAHLPTRELRRAEAEGGVDGGVPLLHPGLQLGQAGDQRDQGVFGSAVGDPFVEDGGQGQRLWA